MSNSPPPLISIIVPIYKVEPYIHKCLDSIITQTYKNLEVILVDDGSPDNCPEICDTYVQLDSRIKVIHKKNKGLACARNTGLDASLGEYICFVDGDDFIHQENIDSLFQLIIKFHADIAIGAFQTSIGNKTAPNKKHTVQEEILSPQQSLYRFTSLNVTTAFQTISLCNKLYNSSLFNNIRCPEGKNYEDTATTYKLLFQSSRIAYTSKILYYYFIRTDSIIGTEFSTKNMEFTQAYQEALLYFKKKGELDIAKTFIPPLLIRLMFSYWGTAYILKQPLLAKELLNQYRQYITQLHSISTIGIFWKMIFRLLGRFPLLYVLYKKYSPVYYNDRKRI